VLALHRLDVRSASVRPRGSTAVAVCRVQARFGSLPDWALVQHDLLRALAGELDVAAVLASREAAYAPRTALPVAEPAVRLLDDASDSATVVEVHAADGLGVLHRITAALTRAGLDVRTAHISTLGADVVDAFYVVGPDGGKLTGPLLRDRLQQELLVALRR
jgi:[protein-PII] uridylyltransferase